MSEALYKEWMEEHAKWAHPGDTKFREIVGYYPYLFSERIRRFVKSTVPDTVTQRRCKTCVLMKGARKYRKSKRMKEKQRGTHEQRLQQRALARTGSGPVRAQFADTPPKRV